MTAVFCAFALVCAVGAETLAKVTEKAFLDISIDGGESQRVVIGLFGDVVPKTVRNFALFIIIDKNLESNREIIAKNFDKILSISGMDKEDLN